MTASSTPIDPCQCRSPEKQRRRGCSRLPCDQDADDAAALLLCLDAVVRVEAQETPAQDDHRAPRLLTRRLSLRLGEARARARVRRRSNSCGARGQSRRRLSKEQRRFGLRRASAAAQIRPTEQRAVSRAARRSLPVSSRRSSLDVRSCSSSMATSHVGARRTAACASFQEAGSKGRFAPLCPIGEDPARGAFAFLATQRTRPRGYSGTLLPPRHVSPGLNVFGVAPKKFSITPRRTSCP
jgi:hypothetical protein